MHNCKKGAGCKFLIDGDQKHVRRFTHGVTVVSPNSPGVAPKKLGHMKTSRGWHVTEVDKSNLKNPIFAQTNAWMHSPYQKVALVTDNSKEGHIIGWELSKADACVTTGNLVVTFGQRKEALDPASVVKVDDSKKSLRAPWDHPVTVVYSCSEVVAAFDSIFAQKVSGTKGATFMEVFKVLVLAHVIDEGF